MSNGAVATANRVRELTNTPASMALDVDVIERVITGGDLSQLTPQQRVEYYIDTCESLGVNWRTKPFDMVRLKQNGPMILYPNKGLAEQFAGKYGISAESVRSDEVKGIYREWFRASLPSGRSVTKMGAVPIAGLGPNDLANAYMKTETKAFRRAVLALVGLNMLDPSELDTVPGAQRASIDLETGEIKEQPGTVEVTIVAPTQHTEPAAGDDRNQQSLSENGVDMMDGQQRGRIMFLAGKLNWEMPAVNGFADEMTGVGNIDLLSKEQAAYLIPQMEGQVPGKQRP